VLVMSAVFGDEGRSCNDEGSVMLMTRSVIENDRGDQAWDECESRFRQKEKSQALVVEISLWEGTRDNK
jgi:hypothetical protein